MAARHAPQSQGRTIRSWTRYYDLVAWLVLKGQASGIRKEVLRIAQLRPGQAVLDVGCGTGLLTQMAARGVAPSGTAVGIDASPEMIATAQRKASRVPNAAFQLSPIQQLPFEDNRFDVALSSFMMHHLPPSEGQKGLIEVARVLKPGGHLVIVDLGDPDFLARVVGHHLPADYVARLQGRIAEAGFTSVERIETKYKSLAFLLCAVGG